LRAIIYHAAGVIMKDLIEALRQEGIDDAWVIGSSIGEPSTADWQPDVVFGVLNGPSRGHDEWFDTSDSRSPGLNNYDVVLRVGHAVTSGVPTLLIVPIDVSAPHRYRDLLTIQVDVNSKFHLERHVRAFFSMVQHSEKRPRQSKVMRTLSSEDNIRFKNDMNRIHEVDSILQRAISFEFLIHNLLVELDERFEQNPLRDSVVDFALLPSDGTSQAVFITAKMGKLDEPTLRRAEDLLREEILQRGGGIGLVIYSDDLFQKIGPDKPSPLVLRIDFYDLVDRLSKASFDRVLADEVQLAISRI
jgi:hypothetical protein